VSSAPIVYSVMSFALRRRIAFSLAAEYFATLRTKLFYS